MKEILTSIIDEMICNKEINLELFDKFKHSSLWGVKYYLQKYVLLDEKYGSDKGKYLCDISYTYMISNMTIGGHKHVIIKIDKIRQYKLNLLEQREC